MGRRLQTIANEVNGDSAVFRGLTARMERGYYNTDRKIPGTRLRRPGRDRHGNRIVIHVTDHPTWVLLDHNAAAPYRYNNEVEQLLVWWRANSVPLSCGRNPRYTRKQILRGAPWR
jgi:hypothetical protein